MLTQRLFPNVSELQVRVDGVNATRCHCDAVDVAVRESTRVVNHGDSFATVSVPHRNHIARESFGLGEVQIAPGAKKGEAGGAAGWVEKAELLAA